MDHIQYEAMESRQRQVDSAEARADFWRDKYKSVQDRHRSGFDPGSPSLELARRTLMDRFADLREQIAGAESDAATANEAVAEASLRRDRALIAAQHAQSFVDEILDQVALRLNEEFHRGQRSRRLSQIGGGFLLGVLSSFVATWLFELFLG